MPSIQPQVDSKINRRFLPLPRLYGHDLQMETDIGKLIREGIDRKGLKQMDLANACNVSVQAVSKWLSESKVAKKHLPTISALLDIPLEKLLPSSNTALQQARAESHQHDTCIPTTADISGRYDALTDAGRGYVDACIVRALEEAEQRYGKKLANGS